MKHGQYQWNARRITNQSAVEKISNSIDVLLMDAYVITSDINSSDVINKYAMQKKDIIKNNVSEAEVMTEIKNYMISRYNINIYDVLLMLNDSDSAFSSLEYSDLIKQQIIFR